MKEILEAKEMLFSLQQELLERALVVVQVGLNMPGGYSLYPWKSLFTLACQKLNNCLHILARDGNAVILHTVDVLTAVGPYRLIALRADGCFIKAELIAIEESEPQGRLWDLDVFTTAAGVIDRAALGLPPRQCLLCAQPAHECRRLGIHTGSAVIQAALHIAENKGGEQS